MGRRRELSELKLALGSSRLVTLTGPGGVGKTRLALRIAGELQRSFRDGAWLIELADVRDATQIAKTMMTALGLAAVRLRSLTVQEIVSRLRDRFALLRGGGATAPPRQRALEATIDWSYTLLTPSEQMMLRRLAVFVGSVDLEAAEAVCTGGGVRAIDVLDLISSLIEKSLLYREDDGIHPRYRLHETMREYGLVQLRAADELDSMRVAHLRWYRHVADRVEADSFGPQLPDWFRQLDADISNIRAALQFSLDRPEHVDSGLELAAALYFWWHTRAPAEASNTIQALLRGGGSDRCRGHALWVLGALNVALGDFELADSALAEALIVASRAKDTHAIAMTLLDQALLEISAGRDLAEAERYLTESHSLATALGDAMATMYARLLMGARELAVGQPEAAKLHLAAAIDISRQHDDSYLLAQALMVDGIIELSIGSQREAEANLKDSLGLVRRMDNRVIGVTTVLQALAAVALARGHATRAARLHGACSAVIRQQRLPGHHPYMVKLAAATAESTRERLGARTYAADFAAGERMRLDEAIAFALEEKPEYIPPEARAARPRTELAKREIEVGRLVAEGLTNKEIAARLFLSDRTIESHVRHILNKLGLASRVQIASWFSRDESHATSVGSR